MFILKTLNKLDIERSFCKVVKVICDKPKANNIQYTEQTKAESFFSKTPNKTRMFTFTNLIEHESPNQ